MDAIQNLEYRSNDSPYIACSKIIASRSENRNVQICFRNYQVESTYAYHFETSWYPNHGQQRPDFLLQPWLQVSGAQLKQYSLMWPVLRQNF